MHDFESFGSDETSIENKLVCRSCKVALSESRLPGIDYALNPYDGCAHDCVYCYAPFISRRERQHWKNVIVKKNLLKLLRFEAPKKRGIIGLSTITDPYQPIEERLRLTRHCLEILVRNDADITILTKSHIITRDIDLLKQLSKVEIGITITTVDDDMARIFEPGAPPPSRRLRALKELNDANFDTYVLIGPVMPFFNELDFIKLAKSIYATGCSRVIIDRMRFKQGMMEYLHSRLHCFEFWQNLQLSLESIDYLQNLEKIVGKICEGYGLKVQKAF
ncbi:MAG: radical SAM protein [Methanomassiliicoccales archaeon]